MDRLDLEGHSFGYVRQCFKLCQGCLVSDHPEVVGHPVVCLMAPELGHGLLVLGRLQTLANGVTAPGQDTHTHIQVNGGISHTVEHKLLVDNVLLMLDKKTFHNTTKLSNIMTQNISCFTKIGMNMQMIVQDKKRMKKYSLSFSVINSSTSILSFLCVFPFRAPTAANTNRFLYLKFDCESFLRRCCVEELVILNIIILLYVLLVD